MSVSARVLVRWVTELTCKNSGIVASQGRVHHSSCSSLKHFLLRRVLIIDMVKHKAVAGVGTRVGKNLAMIIHDGFEVVRNSHGLFIGVNIDNILERHFSGKFSFQWRSNSNDNLEEFIIKTHIWAGCAVQ
jgi:hypothetical protein